MSKGNMLLGHARGKVGDIVFSRSNGQQVVRARAAVVKNPRTDAQIIQRTLLNTVAQAYSRMSAIVDHSIEGLQPGQATMSQFMRDNIRLLQQKVSAQRNWRNAELFTPAGTNGYANNEYIVAKGSLPVLRGAIASYTDGGVQHNAIGFALPANTYQSVLETYGLQRGDQITICQVHSIDDVTDMAVRFDFARVILSPTNADGSEAPLSSPFIVGGAINLPSPRNEGDIQYMAIDGGSVVFDLLQSTDLFAACLIVSRKSADGSWMRSNASMIVAPQLNVGTGYDLGSAVDLFKEGLNAETANARFLNNAGVSSAASVSGLNVATLVVSNPQFILDVRNNSVVANDMPVITSERVCAISAEVSWDSSLVDVPASQVYIGLISPAGASGNVLIATVPNGRNVVLSRGIDGVAAGSYTIGLIDMNTNGAILDSGISVIIPGSVG